MKITNLNCYLQKNTKGYSINISLPDESRNYIHSESFSLESAVKFRDELISLHIEPKFLSIKPDGTYFRIYLSTEVKTESGALLTLKFHSRKLNLNDALYEYDLLAEPKP